MRCYQVKNFLSDFLYNRVPTKIMVANTTMLYCIGAKYNFSLQYENLTAIPISHSRQIPDKLKFNALSQYLYYKNPNFLNLYPALQNLKKHGYEHNDSYHNGRYAKETAFFRQQSKIGREV